jgi:hypothetical protein
MAWTDKRCGAQARLASEERSSKSSWPEVRTLAYKIAQQLEVLR